MTANLLSFIFGALYQKSELKQLADADQYHGQRVENHGWEARLPICWRVTASHFLYEVIRTHSF